MVQWSKHARGSLRHIREAFAAPPCVKATPIRPSAHADVVHLAVLHIKITGKPISKHGIIVIGLMIRIQAFAILPYGSGSFF